MAYIGKWTAVWQNNRREAIINIVGVAVLAGLLLTGAVWNERGKEGAVSCQEQLAKEVLRFHVIANSDSMEDQSVKLRVKEAVLEAMRAKLADVNTAEEAKAVIAANMEEMEAVADRVLADEGYTYRSNAVLGKTTFPVKQYGDMIFPAGEYEAFRILLGEAEGKNWWCVMFPTLCYVDEAYDVITEENKEKFREILTEEEYESLFADSEGKNVQTAGKKGKRSEEVKVFYKLKSALWLNKVIDYFSK